MKSLPGRIIRSSRAKLAVTYLSIIMILSFGFSTVFYMQSVSEAKGNLLGQAVQLREYLYFTTPQGLQSIQDEQLVLFKQNLIKKLAALNAGMFILGGCLSVILARRSLRPLEQALDSQGRFTSDAAHELRTPLTAMKTEIEVALRDKGLKTSEAREVLGSNLEEIAKLETLTAALLRLAQGSKQPDKSAWQNYKLNDILRAANDRLADKAAVRNIKVNLPKNGLNVFGDPDQLVELFVTILGNAIKYSHDDSEVSIKSRRFGNKIQVDITDKGVGITEVDLPHIFERFYRADSSRTRSSAEGYGLGLSLAQAIVEAHDGKIRVKTEYKKGSTFSIELPAA